jgi:hypothetical protein
LKAQRLQQLKALDQGLTSLVAQQSNGTKKQSVVSSGRLYAKAAQKFHD